VVGTTSSEDFLSDADVGNHWSNHLWCLNFRFLHRCTAWCTDTGLAEWFSLGMIMTGIGRLQNADFLCSPFSNAKRQTSYYAGLPLPCSLATYTFFFRSPSGEMDIACSLQWWSAICIFTMAASSGKRNVMVWRHSVCPSVCLSRQHTHRDSP